LDGLTAAWMDAQIHVLAEERRHLERLSPQRRVQDDRQRLDGLLERCARGMINAGQMRRVKLDGLASRIGALNPLGVISRGYAVVRDQSGRALTSVAGVRPGDALSLRLADGEIDAEAVGIRPEL
jgi:exodeoxyribonuclease VII large subunit